MRSATAVAFSSITFDFFAGGGRSESKASGKNFHPDFDRLGNASTILAATLLMNSQCFRRSAALATTRASRVPMDIELSSHGEVNLTSYSTGRRAEALVPSDHRCTKSSEGGAFIPEMCF